MGNRELGKLMGTCGRDENEYETSDPHYNDRWKFLAENECPLVTQPVTLTLESQCIILHIQCYETQNSYTIFGL